MRFVTHWRATPLLIGLFVGFFVMNAGLPAQGADGVALAALEKCWFERHRAVSPPGEAVIRVHFGMTDKAERWVDANQLFTFLKAADGKTCQVDWVATKREISEWLVKLNGQEFTHSDELEALIAKQSRVPAPEPAPPLAAVSASPSPAVAGACEARLAEVREQVSGLKGANYDTAALRGARVDSILNQLTELSTCLNH
jgi:hypothetical protein